MVNAYNREMNALNASMRLMRTAADYQNSSKRAQVEQYLRKLHGVVAQVPSNDPNKAQMEAGIAGLERGYLDNLKKLGIAEPDLAVKATASQQSSAQETPKAATAQALTAEESQRLRQFRNTFIGRDYLFRSIDTIALQDSQYRSELETALKTLQDLLEPIRAKTFDRGVLKAHEDLKNIEDAYAAASGISQKQAENAGDVDQELKTVQEQFDRATFDPRLQGSYEDIEKTSDVRAWATQLKTWQETIPNILAFIEKAKNNSSKARTPEFQAYAHWFKNSVSYGIDEAIKDKINKWERIATEGIKVVNVPNPSYLTDALSSQEGVKSVMDRHSKGKKFLLNLMAFEETYHGAISPKTHEKAQKYEFLSEKLSDAYTQNIKNQRMPQAVSNKQELLDIADRILKGITPEYRVLGPIQKMRITSDIEVTNEMRFDNDAWRHNQWETFAVAFAEAYKGKHYITYAVFKKINAYYAGVQPVGRWYLLTITPQGAGEEIMKEHL